MKAIAILAAATLALSASAETLNEYKANLITSGQCASVGVLTVTGVENVDTAGGKVDQTYATLNVVAVTAYGHATTQIRIIIDNLGREGESCQRDMTPVALTDAQKETLLFEWLAQKQAAGYQVTLVDAKDLGVFGAAVFFEITDDAGTVQRLAIKEYNGALQFLDLAQ